MYKSRVAEPVNGAKSQLGYFEMDPSGRYGRFKEILGKGAMKTVYRAFDEVLGMEVAWNQVKLNDVFRSPDELQRLYSEVHLLKNLNHDSIMRFYTSWIDIDRRTFNFITEMFTSGSLREYRQKYKRVNIRAVKDWSRQILEGLAYLHGHDPPVIHRDLKCDNIFVNGHLGQVKIGDLGLAATLRESHHCHSVIGTPEFMAPELYEEDYNELVDIYSFGMCVLEMLTSEYPYSECSNPAQIYKKVTSGKLPKAFYQIEDAEAQRFIGKCLENASTRPSANELLMDPFLATVEDDKLMVMPKLPCEMPTPNETIVERPNLFSDPTRTTDMTITGTMNAEDDTIFLKVQICNKDGQARNIYFPFDISSDTALDVAMEMVKELDITDWEPFEIAEMINDEISALVPNYHQHSFNYDDDDKTHHPFYSLLSHSSSETSLPGLFTSCETQSHQENSVMASNLGWNQENFLVDDDTSSQSSLNSPTYSNLNFCSGNENDYDSSSIRGEPDFIGKMHNWTRFCPGGKTTKSSNNQCEGFPNARKALKSNPQKKQITRTASLVDVRSQLLYRSLVEEISKRRLFNTIGAIENIGYHEPPGEFSSRMLVTGGFSGKFAKV